MFPLHLDLLVSKDSLQTWPESKMLPCSLNTNWLCIKLQIFQSTCRFKNCFFYSFMYNIVYLFKTFWLGLSKLSLVLYNLLCVNILKFLSSDCQHGTMVQLSEEKKGWLIANICEMQNNYLRFMYVSNSVAPIAWQSWGFSPGCSK